MFEATRNTEKAPTFYPRGAVMREGYAMKQERVSYGGGMRGVMTEKVSRDYYGGESEGLPLAVEIGVLENVLQRLDSAAQNLSEVADVRDALHTPDAEGAITDVLTKTHLEQAQLSAEALSSVVDGQIRTLRTHVDSLRAEQRVRYLAECAPVPIGETAVLPNGHRRKVTDYVIQDMGVKAVLDGLLVPARKIKPVDAITKLGELVQTVAEEDEGDPNYVGPYMGDDYDEFEDLS